MYKICLSSQSHLGLRYCHLFYRDNKPAALFVGRYHRLPLPVDGAPLEAQLDAFVSFLRVRVAPRHSIEKMAYVS